MTCAYRMRQDRLLCMQKQYKDRREEKESEMERVAGENGN